jgi:hypothetical protein
LSINAGGASTDNPVVTLNSTCTGSPKYYMASESSTFKDVPAWTPYSAAPTFTLSSTGGAKKVYFKVVNVCGSVSVVVTDAITLNAPVVNAFSINGGATNATTQTVRLNNLCSGSAPTEYMASESSTFITNTGWLPYSTAPTFTLSSGSGAKTVYFKVRNQYGAVSTAVKNDAITLVAPTLSTFTINKGAASTAVAAVSLNSVITGSTPSQYMASESLTSITLGTAAWNTYATSVTFTLSSPAGVKTVYFKVRNSFGVESGIKSDTITKTAVTTPTPKVGATTTANAAAKTVAVTPKVAPEKTTDTPVAPVVKTDVVTTGTLAKPNLQVTGYALDATADGFVGTLTIANTGNADAGAFHVALYFCTSDTLSLLDAVLAQEVAVDGLAVGAETTATFALPGTPDDVYPIFALDSQSEVAVFDWFKPNTLLGVAP